MAWNVKVSKGGGDGSPREVCPPDQYPGMVVGVIDLGHQHEQKFQSQEMEWVPKVVLVWEAVGATASGGNPFYFARSYRLSLHEKASFRKVLELAGVSCDGDDVDIASVLGKYHLLEVVNGTSSKNTAYAALSKENGISKLPKVMTKGLPQQPTRPFLLHQIADGALPKHEWLPFIYGRSITDIQAESRELGGKAQPRSQMQAAGKAEDDEDTIPF